MRKVAVIGLGRFGMALATRLASLGADVLAIDRNGQFVNEVADQVNLAVRLDSTDRQALLSQDVDKVDVAVVAIGENFEAALLTTVLLKQIGVSTVICRAQSAVHAQIFQQIGADRVIQPEQETGAQVARQLAHPHLLDFIRLATGYSLIEYKAPKAFEAHSIRQLDLRAKYNVNLIVIRRATEGPAEVGGGRPDQVIVPSADDVIQAGDVLVFVGADESLARLPKE